MTTSPSQNAEGHQVWNPSVGTYFSPASNQRESYGGVIGALQDQIAYTSGTNKAFPQNFAGIIAAIEELIFTQDKVPTSPDVRPPGGNVIINPEGNPEWIVATQPRDGDLWFDTRQGRLFIAFDEEFYQTNGADGLAYITSTSTAPDQPVLGQFWWDASSSSLYIFDGFWRDADGNIDGNHSPGATPIWRLITSASGTFASSAIEIPSTSTIRREPTGSTLPALNFANLNNQNEFNEWIYDSLQSLETAVDADEGGNARIESSATAPTSPAEGHLWYDTTSDTLKVYASSNWAIANPQLNYDADVTTLTGLITAEETARQSDIASLTTQLATTVTSNSTFQTLQGTVSALQTQVSAIPVVDASLLTPKTDTTALTNRVSTLESAAPDLSVYESIANAASTIATVNARIDALPTTSQLSAVSANIPSISGLATETYVDNEVTEAVSDYLAKAGGTLTGGIVMNTADVTEPGLDFTTAATNSQTAFKFVANDGYGGTNTTTFGSTDNYWEYAYNFSQDEDFCWVHNTNKVLSVNKDGVACNQLYLTDFQPNTTSGRVLSNPINVRTKLAGFDTELSTIRSDIAALNTGLGTATGRVFYGDTAPTVTLRNGDVWFDSSTLRLYVNHGGAWIYPDRVEDTALKTSLLNAVNSSTDYASLKTNLATALS